MDRKVERKSGSQEHRWRGTGVEKWRDGEKMIAHHPPTLLYSLKT
ncbi:hypothetical protein [Candidatus Nitrosocosmicus franklandus]|nr:hypothetical protein [Candidatus Nitrosocosmicus franklandus]